MAADSHIVEQFGHLDTVVNNQAARRQGVSGGLQQAWVARRDRTLHRLHIRRVASANQSAQSIALALPCFLALRVIAPSLSNFGDRRLRGSPFRSDRNQRFLKAF